jgi:hypothetical protein
MLLAYDEKVEQLEAKVIEMAPSVALMEAHVAPREWDTLSRFVRTLAGFRFCHVAGGLQRPFSGSLGVAFGASGAAS